jgi:2-polyprenyl-3-methyl-5-hydroxy-6-metoxy-1,4-benzoquinol methylase
LSITHTKCPVCAAANLQPALQATDFTVTKQQFEIWQCGHCALRFTQHIPSANEIGAYYKSEAYVSHTDTSKGLVNKLYHIVRKRTLQKKLRLIQHHTGLQKGNLLDVGAGTGAFINTAVEGGWNSTGLEPDEDTRKLANSLYKTALKPSAELFELAPESFDAITMWHVLEHVHELQRYMAQLRVLLKQHGKLFIAVPNYTSYDANMYKSNWAAYDVPRHLYHFSPQSIKELLALHQLKLEVILPMWYDSFYVAMLSEQYKTGKSNLLKAGFAGMLSNLKALANLERCSSLIYVIGK